MRRAGWMVSALIALSAISCTSENPAHQQGSDGTDGSIQVADGSTLLPDEQISYPSELGAPDQLVDLKSGFTILSIKSDQTEIAPGGSVNLTIQIRNDSAADLTGGEVWVEAKCPDGRLFNQKTPDPLNLAAGATGESKQLRGPYTIEGGWVFTPSLKDSAGKLLATGTGVTVNVKVPPITNPLSGIADYTQFDTSPTTGSCGSHSGAVAIAYIKGLRSDTSGTLAIEHNIYNRVPYGPGESDLKVGYNGYLKAAGMPYTAVSISSGSVQSHIQAGKPVVAHVYNHYVCIYGLINDVVYFSDGVTGYSTSGSTAVSSSGHLRKMSWSAFKGKLYGGFIGFNHN